MNNLKFKNVLKKATLIYITLLFCSFASVLAQSADITTFILVRHAEKASDHPQDPSLSDEGLIRSRNLTSLFANQPVAAVFSTDLKRTRQTVQGVADRWNIAIETYLPAKQNLLKSRILSEYAGKTILISGHSNTIPALLNMLLEENRFENFPETQYGDLFIITLADGLSPSLLRLKF